MNFDNLKHHDLMTGLYVYPIWLWTYSLDCVIQCEKEFKIHSVETARGKSEVKRENRDLCKTKNVIKR